MLLKITSYNLWLYMWLHLSRDDYKTKKNSNVLKLLLKYPFSQEHYDTQTNYLQHNNYRMLLKINPLLSINYKLMLIIVINNTWFRIYLLCYISYIKPIPLLALSIMDYLYQITYNGILLTIFSLYKVFTLLTLDTKHAHSTSLFIHWPTHISSQNLLSTCTQLSKYLFASHILLFL